MRPRKSHDKKDLLAYQEMKWLPTSSSKNPDVKKALAKRITKKFPFLVVLDWVSSQENRAYLPMAYKWVWVEM